jgi:hypothetical protein
LFIVAGILGKVYCGWNTWKSLLWLEYLENILVPPLAGLFGSVMAYSAIGLALIGFGTGLAFRWKVLLPVVVLIPLAAIIFSVSRGFSYREAVMVIAIAEGVLQAGYILGLSLGVLTAATLQQGGALNVRKTRRNPDEQTKDGHTLPSAGAGKAP